MRVEGKMSARMMIAVAAQLLLLSYVLDGAAPLQPLTPCPEYFEYVRGSKSQGGVMRGRVVVPPGVARKNASLHLKVALSLATALPTRYNGRLELEHSREKSVRAVLEGRPLTYRVLFPIPRPIARLTGIWFNGRKLCTGSGARGRIVTSIVLEHTLYPAGVRRPASGGGGGGGKAQAAEKEAAGEQSDCGRRGAVDGANLLVARGRETLPGQWPWVVAIFLSSNPFRLQCAGSLISERHVLTAAHCFRLDGSGALIPASGLFVSLGRQNLRGWHEKDSVSLDVAEYRAHPEYRDGRKSADGDLGIVVLWQRVEFNELIRPICLWSGPVGLDAVVGRRGIVVGWGKDEEGNPYTAKPRATEVPIVSQESCLRSHADFAEYTSNRTFCGGTRDGSGPCSGDSGSGLVIFDERRKRYHLRGVVSRSLYDEETRSCDLRQYVVYVDVAQHLDWLREQLVGE